MNQDTATITVFSNVNNLHFHSNFPPNYMHSHKYYWSNYYNPNIFVSMIIIWRHVHILLISQYWLLWVNIHSKSLESLDHRAQWLGVGTPICGQGREVPRWWPPFWGFSIGLDPYCIPEHNPIDLFFLLKTIGLSLSHLLPET